MVAEGNYLFDPNSYFLNSLFLGPEAASAFVSPELRKIIALNQTRDAVRQLADTQLASLYGQRESLMQLADLNAGVQELGDRIGDGLGGLSQGINAVGSGISHLARNMEHGFEQLGMGLQTGFEAVVKGLYHVDERLGQRVLLGFSALGGQLRHQHVQTVGTLITGFGFLGDVIDRASERTVAAIEQAAEAQIEAIFKAADQVTHAIVETGRLQAEALLGMHRQLSQQLGDITAILRNPDATRATEHFMVGMNFLNNVDIRRAHEQFVKARSIYAGHFATLIAYGFCCRVLGDVPSAQDAFESAFSQVAVEPEQGRRQRALAALYLGRIAFDQQRYDQARRWFHQTYRNEERLWTALVEGAASLLLDPTRQNRNADALAVKKDFNRFGDPKFKRVGPDACVLWYSLALVLAPVAPDIALEAFRHGAHGDYRVKERDRDGLIALLWQLNRRAASTLLDLIKSEFSWL